MSVKTNQKEKKENPNAIGFDVKIIFGLLALSLILFIAGLAFDYYWDVIKTPSGNEQSVPAVRTY